MLPCRSAELRCLYYRIQHATMPLSRTALPVLQDTTCQGWLSSGKKGISSLPREETWEKREETPFFPEEMEETRKKLGIKVCYSLLHHCQQL